MAEQAGTTDPTRPDGSAVPEPPQATAESQGTPEPSPDSEGTPPAEGSGEPASQSQSAPTISWATLTPEDRERLLEEADPEELRKHKRISGLAGQMADKLTSRRVKELKLDELPTDVRDSLFRRVEQDVESRRTQAERERLAESGEYYTLGQQEAERVRLAKEQQAARQQSEKAQAEGLLGFYEQTHEWAKANFPAEVLNKTAADINEEMQTLQPRQQYDLWLKTLTANQVEHQAKLRETEARSKWEKEELPAHRSRWLAERNGNAPTPETEGGSPQGTRTLTDEMIAAMSLEEFKAVWGDNGPKPGSGWVYKPTRAIDPRTLKMSGQAR
jgi:hypothetical protein